MNENNVLDWNPLSALGLFPEMEEDILWFGQPSLKPLIPGINAGSLDRFWLIYYGGIFICFRNSWAFGIIWPVFLAIGAIFFIQVLPFLISYFKISRTAYVVTNKRIVLKIWRFFVEKTYILRYDDFQRSTCVMHYPNTDSGTVYLMTGKDPGFWTHDIQTGERRQHPTLECVKGAEALALQIEKIRVEQLKSADSKPKYSPAILG